MRITPGLLVLTSAFAALALGQSAAKAQTVVFDSLTNAANIALVNNTPRTFIGQAFDAESLGPAGLAVTSIDFRIVSQTAQTYQNMAVNVQFWGISTDAFSGSDPVFSQPAPLQTLIIGPRSVNDTSNFAVSFDFATPVVLSNYQNIGVSFNVQGDTGSGLMDTNNLHVGVRGGPGNSAPLAGSVPMNPNRNNNTFYYRNTSGRTDYNFAGSDARDIGSVTPAGGEWSMVAMRIHAQPVNAIPEPGTFALLGVGLLPLAGLLTKRRKP